MKKLLLLMSLLLCCSGLILAQGNCGTTMTAQEKIQYSNWVQTVEKSGKHNYQKGTIRVVPVKIHIVRKADKTGGTSVQKAISDIHQANVLFAGVGFQFKQCGAINYIDNDTYQAEIEKSNSSNSDEHKMANAHKESNALNVFYCPNTKASNGPTSWATFPDNQHGKNWIIMWRDHADNGSTFSHEVGHWFNLLHTHHGDDENVTRDNQDNCFNCWTKGDLLCDTPADWNGTNSHFDSYPTCQYNGSKMDDCNTALPYNPSPNNIMSYAGKACRTVFTNDQITRMHYAYDLERTELHGTVCTTAPPNCATPSGGSSSNLTNNSARVSCNTSNFSQLMFRYRVYGSTSWSYKASNTNTYVDLTGLTSGTNYQWQVRKTCNSGVQSSWSSFKFFQTKGGSCTPPASNEYSVHMVGSVFVRLLCTSTGSYKQFRYRKSGTTAWKYTPKETFNQQEIVGLNPGTTYQWQCRRQCANGQWSAYASTKTFQTPCGSPKAAENSVTSITINTATLNTADVGTNFIFVYREKGVSSWKIGTPSGNKAVISGLTDGTEYEWRTKRKCAGTWTGWSPIMSFTTKCAKPTLAENTTSVTTCNQAKLKCSSSGSSRQFRHRKQGTAAWTTNGSTTGSFFIITGLTPSTTYQWQSRRKCVNGWSPWSGVETFLTPCCAPTTANNTTTGITSTKAKLNCYASATKYRFIYREVGATSWKWPVPQTGNTLSVTGLSNGTNYEWRVKRFCGAWSNWSPKEFFKTVCPAPFASQNTTSNITSSSAKLNTSVAGDKYQFRYRKSSSSTWTTLATSTASGRFITGLAASTAYKWQARKKCPTGWSYWSVLETFTTACSAPTAANTKTTNISAATAKLNCFASASKYRFIYREVGAGAWNWPAPKANNTLTITGLSQGTNYEWRVRRLCGAWSPWSPKKTFKTICPATTASQNTTSNITSTSAKLNTSAAADSYQFRYRKSSVTTWTTMGASVAKGRFITGLSASTTYKWQARKKCPAGWSYWSPVETFITACKAPTAANNTTTNISITAAKLNCNASATKYRFIYREVGASAWKWPSPQTGKILTVTGLTQGTNYEWRVRRLCSAWSPWSPIEIFKTICPAATASQNTTTNITAGSARLNCSASGIKYQFRYRKSSVTSWTTLPTHTANNKVITGLTANTTYKWQTRKKCSAGWSAWGPVNTFKTPQPYCSHPTASSNSTTGITPIQARLNTTAGGTDRQFRFRKSSISTWTTGGSTTLQYFIITSLSPNTEYSWQSRRKCASGVWSNWSAIVKFNTLNCTAPTAGGNTTTNKSYDKARLNTTAGGSSRQFRHKKAGTTAWTTSNTTSLQYVNISNLYSSTQYTWQSRRKCGSVWSAWSAHEYFTTTTAPFCSAPASYTNTTSIITQTSARLNCSAPSINVQFQYRKKGTTSWSTTSITSGTYQTISSLKAGYEYEWRSKIECTLGNWSGWSSLKIFKTTAPYCSSPASYTNSTSLINGTSARLNCSATAERVQFKHRKKGTYTWKTETATSGTYTSINGLDAGYDYEWQSRRECTPGNWSLWSSTVAFKTTAPYCSAPPSYKNSTSSITLSSAKLNCTETGLNRKFRHRKKGTASWSYSPAVSGLSLTISSLSAGYDYEWQSKRECSPNNWSGWSSTMTFKTSVPFCGPASTGSNHTTLIAEYSARINTTASGLKNQFRYKKASAYSWTTLSATSYSYANLTGLSANTEYEWQSKKECTPGNWSGWSGSDYFWTHSDCDPPASYQNYSSGVQYSTATLNCTASGSQKKFRYRKSTGYSWTTTSASYGNSKTISGLSSSTNYEWQSSVYCYSGTWSDWSNSSSFTTKYTFTDDNPQTPVNTNARGTDSSVNTKLQPQELKENETIVLKLSPNPIPVGESSLLEIAGGQNEAIVLISSITGERILDKKIDLRGKERVKLPPILNSGMYIIVVKSKLQTITKRLIVIE